MTSAPKILRIKGLFLFNGTLLGYVAIIATVWILATGTHAFAQGIERDSLASENAAAAAKVSPDKLPYNLQVGPVNIRVDAGSDVRFVDNINLSNTGQQADCILEPGVGIHALWQATESNAISLDVNASYQHYIVHSGYDAFVVTPGSQTQFNIYVGDFKINLKDGFSYQNDPVQVGQLSNLPQFSRFTNDAGLKVDWDLSDVILTLGYDHVNFWVFEPSYQYLDYQSDIVSPQVTFNVSQTIKAGLNSTFSDVRYDQNIQNNYTQVTVGPFVSAQLSEAIAVNSQIGWVHANFDKGGLNGDTQNIDSYYCSAGINHRINDYVTESLTAGREFLPGITSNFTQRIYANYSPTWQVTSAINLTSQIWWENLDDSNADVRENSNRFGTGLNLTYAATDHITISFGYQFVLKASDQSSLDYHQNQVSIGARYAF